MLVYQSEGCPIGGRKSHNVLYFSKNTYLPTGTYQGAQPQSLCNSELMTNTLNSLDRLTDLEYLLV